MNFTDLGYLRCAAVSPQVHIGNASANTDEILRLANNLHAEGVSLAVFPELCLTGYSAEDLFFSQELLKNTLSAMSQLAAENPLPLLIVGTPWQTQDGRLLNCAAVFDASGLLGLVPKSHNPNHGEFYDLRWFANGGAVNESLNHPALGHFQLRRDQLFKLGGTFIGIEICEDLWAPEPPNTQACLAGAEVMVNLSASNELIAKADYRRDLVRMTSARGLCSYIYAAAGSSESTKDIVFGGHCLIAENGQILAESERFNLAAHTLVADIDLDLVRHERLQNTTFRGTPRGRPFRTVPARNEPMPLPHLSRSYSRNPFVPSDEQAFAARAQEIMLIQKTGLARRMRSAHSEQLVIGLSGGLDSTLAYLVCLDALAELGLPVANLQALTLPGPGTTQRTLNSARLLANTTGATLTEIDIEPAVEQHLADLEHAGAHDVVFENAQARERTQILFNFANKVNGIVVGTGDLSELALGWCTFNADHMAGYNVNASIPKTLMAYLVRWYASHRAPQDLAAVLETVLATPISPELIPPEDGEISQKTEAIVGPYELHDFFLFHFLRYGSTPAKIHHLACLSFSESYPPSEVKHWLSQFFRRFFTQQFKRTTLPPGPKVGSVSLSPRGDWRMPDEAEVEQLLKTVDKL
jgi:NAD+ synthase (glutamine-hydrolysing)